jgi:hypothetical protein
MGELYLSYRHAEMEVLTCHSLQSLELKASGIPASLSKAPGVTLFDDRISNVTFTASSFFKQKNTPSKMSGEYFEGTNFYAYIHGKKDPEGDWWKTESSVGDFQGRGGVMVNCHIDS